MSYQSAKKRRILNKYIDSIYQQSQGFQSYTQQQKDNYLSQDICYTYGELIWPSTLKIVDKLRLTPSDHLLDLGSGLGKFLLQVFLNSTVGQVTGIEGSKILHEQASKVLKQFKQDYPVFWQPNREFELVCDNFLECNWIGVTAVYCCSTCFTKQLIAKIGDKINSTLSINHALSLRPLHTLTRLKLKEVFVVECSWDSALCYWYADEF